MDRAEAIRHYEYGISHDIFKEPVRSYAKMAIAALREQESSCCKKYNEWISVKERLPEIGVPVLVTYRNAIDGKMQGDGVAVQLFGKGCWYWWEGSAQDCDIDVRVEITHWMPLPEAPKEDRPG